MKKLIFILFIATSLSVTAQLNTNANYLKNKYPTDYTQTIRKHAIEEWDTDHEMVVYEINQQADALFNLVNKFKSENTSIAFDAIKEWSQDGYESSNISKFNAIKTFNVENLIKMHCDWEMVEYEYNNQVNAKSSY